MSETWYTRPVLAVRDTPKSLEFYGGKLGFTEDWKYEENDRLRIVQVSRGGCELILSDQWPEDAGRGRIFISLNASELSAISRDFISRGVDVKSGWWGYDMLIVEDGDGNQLWFPQPAA